MKTQTNSSNFTVKRLTRRWRSALLSCASLLLALACQSTGDLPLAQSPEAAPAAQALPPPAPAPQFARPPTDAVAESSPPTPRQQPPAAEPAPFDSLAESESAAPSRAGSAEGRVPAWGGLGKGASPESDRPARKRSVHRPRTGEERPGLATHWGEDRYSPAREVSFERADFNRPLSTAQLRYDDREGARRQLPNGYWSKSEFSSGGGLTIVMVNARGQSFDALRDSDRLIAIGEPGERYALHIENRTHERFEVVVSVDGLDVLDGQPGSLRKRGYLVDAYQTIEIDGFRRSSDQVAAFRLGDVRGSYAASKGRARNVGVIGVAVFGERPRYARRPPSPWQERDRYLRETADPFPGYAQPPSGRR